MAKNGRELNKDKTNVLIIDKNFSNIVSTELAAEFIVSYDYILQ